MRTDKFHLSVRDDKGPEGSEWIKNTFYSNAKDTSQLESILDATAATKLQAVKSGLFSKVDGTLGWEVSKPAQRATSTSAQKLHSLLDSLEQRMPPKILSKFQPLRERYGPKVEQAEFSLPDHLQSVTVNFVAERSKRSLACQSVVDSQKGGGVEVRGFKPFVFGSNWIAQGALQIRGVRRLSPELELRLSRPILAQHQGELDLNTLEILGKAESQKKAHLDHLVGNKTLEYSACYETSSKHTYSGGFRQLKEWKKAAAIRTGMPVESFDRLYMFGSGFKHFAMKNGAIDTNLAVEIPIGTDIKKGVISWSCLWSGAKRYGQHLSFRSRLGLSTISAPNGLVDVPLCRRLFLGGPHVAGMSIPLRGFKTNLVGGVAVPPNPFDDKANTEHLGGAFRLGGSVELALLDILKKTDLLNARLPEIVLDNVKNLSPFVFADAATLLPTVPDSFRFLKTLRISAGVGLSYPVGESARVDVTLAQPLNEPFGEQVSRLNISFVTATI